MCKVIIFIGYYSKRKAKDIAIMLNNVMLVMLNSFQHLPVMLNVMLNSFQHPSNPAVMPNPTPRLSNQTLLHTYKACITPGTQPNIESTTFKRNVLLKPVFINTATGGSRTQRMMVSNDIVCFGFDFNHCPS